MIKIQNAGHLIITEVNFRPLWKGKMFTKLPIETAPKDCWKKWTQNLEIRTFEAQSGGKSKNIEPEVGEKLRTFEAIFG